LLRKSSTLVVLMFVIVAGVGRAQVVLAQTSEDAGPDIPAVEEVIPVTPEVVQEDVAVVKSSLFPAISPYKYIAQDKWNNFLSYVANDGKWIKLNFYYKKGVQAQYFEAYEGERLYKTGPISGAKTNINLLPSQKQGKKLHNHLGLFDVWFRSQKQWSGMYDCWMYWGLFYYGNHGFHAALSKGIPKLGRPDSHGCDRAFPKTAREVFLWAAKNHIKVLTVCEPKVG